DRQTGRQIHRQGQRQTDTETDRYRYRQVQVLRQTERYRDRQTDRQGQTDTETDRDTYQPRRLLTRCSPCTLLADSTKCTGSSIVRAKASAAAFPKPFVAPVIAIARPAITSISCLYLRGCA
ncbi:hypothetical protein B484DRAFT_337658, partial [Ochromonadaceae sp. CCMP2298]